MKSFFTFLVAAAFILGNATNATAQSVSRPVVIGEEIAMYSSVLKKERVLFEKAVEVYQLALKAEPGNDAAKQALTKLGIELSNPATR